MRSTLTLLALVAVLAITANTLKAQDCSFTFQDSIVLCQVDTTTLMGPTDFDTYSWSTGETSTNIVADASGYYTLTATSALCTITDSVYVDLLNGAINQPDTTICAGESLTLSATVAYSGIAPDPEGFSFYGELDGHFYYQSPDTDTWPNARDRANAEGGYLVSINSAAENAFVHAANPAVRQWIGFTDEATEGDWVWLSGEPVTYTNWEGGPSPEPNNLQGAEHYGEMQEDAEWNDLDGTASFPFLIEFDGGQNVEVTWSTNETGNSITVSPSVTTTYYVTFDNGIQTCTDSITVSVENPQFSFAQDTLYACGPTTTLDAGVAEGYLWSTGETTQSIDAGEGTFSLAVNEGACIAEDTLEVIILDPSIAEGNQQICLGESVTLSAVTTPSGGGDFAGFSFEGEFNGSEYYYSNGTSPVANARTACEDNGGYLVSINSAAENNFINSFTGNSQVYIGFTDENNEGTFTWMNGDPVTYTNWNSGEPNDSDPGAGGEDFTVMTAFGDWNDVSGLSAQRFVCEVSEFNDVALEWSTGSTDNSINVQPTQDTWYTLTLTDENQTCTDSVLIEVFTPQYELPEDTLYVCGPEAILDAGAGMASYLWNTGETTQTITVTESGQYYVDVDEGACTSADTLELFLLKANIIEDDQDICLGDSVTFSINQNATQPGDIVGLNYGGEFGDSQYYISGQSQSWTNAQSTCSGLGGHLVTINSAAENNFILSIHSPTRQWIGFTDQDVEGDWQWVTGEPVTYTNWNTPNEPNNSGGIEHYGEMSGSTGEWNDMPNDAILNTFVCEFTNLTTVDIQWSTGDTTEAITVSPVADSIYFVTVTDEFQTCTDTVAVNVFEPQFDFGLDSLFICDSETILDAGTGWESVAWSTGASGQTLTISETGIYSATVDEGACITEDTLNVFMLDPTIQEGDQNICAGETVTMTIAAGGAEAPDDLDGLSFAGEFNGNYYYTSTGTANWTNAANACASQGGYLSVIGSAAENNFIRNLFPSTEQWIGFTDEAVEDEWVWVNGEPVTYTNWGGIEPNNSGNVEHYAHFNTAGTWNDNSVSGSRRYTCEFDAIPGLDILWSTGDTTASITATPDTTTTYYVTIDNGVQICSDTVQVTVNTPQFAFESDTVQVCGAETTLTAEAGFSSYLWSTGSDSTSTTVNSSGLYTIEVDEGACITNDTLFLSLVDATIAQNDTSICFGQELILNTVNTNVNENTQLPGYSYGGELNGNYYFISNGTANYATSEANCTNVGGHLATITSLAEQNLVAGLSSSNIYIGLNDVNQEGTFEWVTGEPVTYTNWGSNEPSDSGAGEDYVHIRSTNDWNDVDGDQAYLSVCEFSGGTELEIIWSTGDTIPELTLVADSTFLYGVSVSDGITTCTDSIFVEVNLLPQPFLGGDTLIVCEADSLLLDPQVDASTFSWNTGETSNVITVGQDGDYSVTVTDSLGCVNADTTYAHFFVSPAINIRDTTLCIGSEVNFELTLNNETVTWPGDITGATFDITPEADTLIVYQVFDGIATCFDTAAVSVSDIALEVLLTEPSCYDSLNGSFIVNPSAGIEPYSFDWNGFNPAQVGKGSYALTVTDSIGCTVDTVLQMTEPAPFFLYSTALPPVCAGADGVIIPQATGGTTPYTFDVGGIDPDAAAPGEYTLSALDANGCEAEQTVMVPASSETCGCTYEEACNYDPAATSDDGSCTYPAEGFDCAGNEVCAPTGVEGCTYEDACNYDPAAETDNGTCTYPLEGYDCAGNCIADYNNNGVCDLEEITGCTYENGFNYDPAATVDDGNCNFSCTGDFNGDDLVNSSDLLQFLGIFGTACP